MNPTRSANEDENRALIVPRSECFDGTPRQAVGGDRVYCGNREPRLRDLLSDPIVHRMMRGDGVGMTALIRLITSVRRRLS